MSFGQRDFFMKPTADQFGSRALMYGKVIILLELLLVLVNGGSIVVKTYILEILTRVFG